MTNFEQVGVGLGIVALVLYAVYLGLLSNYVIGYVYNWVHGGVDAGPLLDVRVPGQAAYPGFKTEEQAKWDRYYSQVAR